MDGNDKTTSILKYNKIPFSIKLMSDFHSDEPILHRVTKIGKDEKEYELYNYWRSLFIHNVEGPYYVLEELVSLGVLKDYKIQK